MEHTHPDRESYDKIWKEIISEEISNYRKTYINLIEKMAYAKEEIWNEYVKLNDYCKVNYMQQAEGKIDRHKVAACYMIAIMITKPVKVVGKIDNKEIPLAINEQLAITVGLSIVRAFVLAAIERAKEEGKISSDDAKALSLKFEDGIKIPCGDLVNHGSYLENYARELDYAASDGKLCILSLAHELYLLEAFTRISE
jgi:hypothetical protein